MHFQELPLRQHIRQWRISALGSNSPETIWEIGLAGKLIIVTGAAEEPGRAPRKVRIRFLPDPDDLHAVPAVVLFFLGAERNLTPFNVKAELVLDITRILEPLRIHAKYLEELFFWVSQMTKEVEPSVHSSITW
jgi:hypothetical protein